MFCSVLTPNSIHASEPVDVSDVPVYTFNEDGEVTPSDMDPNILYGMLQENSNNDLLRQVPGPEGNAIRITDIKRTVNYNAEDIVGAVEFLGGLAWNVYGGALIKAANKMSIGKYTLISALTAGAHNAAVNLANVLFPRSYTETYLYKAWSDYYGVYLVYVSIAVYKNPNYTGVQQFYHYVVQYGDTPIALR